MGMSKVALQILDYLIEFPFAIVIMFSHADFIWDGAPHNLCSLLKFLNCISPLVSLKMCNGLSVGN